MSELIKSVFLQRLLTVLGILIVLIALFTAGVAVGERKFRHLSGLCMNYDKMRSPRHGSRGPFPFAPPMLPSTHGVFGKVLSISDQGLVVQGKDDIEQDVLITSSTMIRIGDKTGTAADIQPDIDASVFGAPNNQGQIEATLIRLFTRP